MSISLEIKNKNLIGISGKANSGKDLVGQIIQYFTSTADSKWNFETYQRKYTTLGNFGVGYLPTYEIKKFADDLKNIICIILGCTREQLEDRTYKEKELGGIWDNSLKLSPRTLLIKLGTDLCRNQIHNNIWINSTFSNYTPEDCYIFTDLRFPNELKAIQERNGLTIRLFRPRDITGIIEHESETALDKELSFDYFINNDGSIEELISKVKEILIIEKII